MLGEPLESISPDLPGDMYDYDTSRKQNDKEGMARNNCPMVQQALFE